MTDPSQKALLPAGLRDILPPVAAQEAAAIEKLIAVFAERGYQRTKAPLVEFEDGLMAGAGAAMSGDTFRLMDPVSQRMMGVRADITPQIARIALTRLAKEPWPLRLSYSGEVLRVRSTQLRPERQFAQVGAELIGVIGAHADAEIILMAVEALRAIGIPEQTVDLTIPPLVPALFDAYGVTGQAREDLRHALDRKDIADVRRIAGAAADVFASLIEATGPAERCLAVLADLDIPESAARERDRLGEVQTLLAQAGAKVPITIDPVENRGFEYHTGIGFTVFAPGVRGELGSGGRYRAVADGAESADGDDNGTGNGGEPATGFTLYVDTILRVLDPPEPPNRVYLPVGSPEDEARSLRAEGYVTISGLSGESDAAAEARRLRCTHLWRDGAVHPLD